MIKKIFFKKIINNCHVLLTLSALFWGFNAIAGRSAVGEISPFLIVSGRWFGVLLILSFICRNEIKVTFLRHRNRHWWFICMGFVGFTCFNSFYYVAAHHTVAINLGIVQSTMPAFIIIISMLWLKSKISILHVFGLLTTFLGVLIVISNGSLKSLISLELNNGDLIMIIACIFYAFYAVGLKKKPEISNLILMTFFSYVAFIGSIPGVLIEYFSDNIIWPTNKGLLILLIIIIFPSFLAQIFFMKGVEKLGPATSGLYTNLVPIFSSFLAIFILNENFFVFHLLSLIIIFFGIYIFEYKSKNN